MLTMTGYVATQPLRLAHARALPSGSPLWWAWGTSTRLPLLLKDHAWYAHMMLLFSSLPSACICERSVAVLHGMYIDMLRLA